MISSQDLTDKILAFCDQYLPQNRKSKIVEFFIQQQIFPYLFDYPGLRSIPGFNDDLYVKYKIDFAKRRLQLDKALKDFLYIRNKSNDPLLLIKGIAFEDLYYPIELKRSFSDIDIFVSSNSSFEYDKRFFDVHTQISDWPLKKYLSYDKAKLDCQLVQSNIGYYYSLSDRNNFLLMVSHGTKHHWCRLRWILDLVWYVHKLAISTEDLSTLRQECRQVGLGKSMEVALVFASKFINEQHPACDWVNNSVCGDMHKIANSIIQDLIRKRNQNFREKTKNIFRSLALKDSNLDSISYLLDRIYLKIKANT